MTTYPQRLHLHRPHINPWLLVVALAAALIGLGSWVIVDQTTSATASANPPQDLKGLASARAAAMIEHRLALMNNGTDWKAFAALYTKSAVLEERDVTPPVITKGATQIAEHQRGYWQMGMRINTESPIIQYGPYAAYAISMAGMSWAGIGVFRLNENGKIAQQWVIGG